MPIGPAPPHALPHVKIHPLPISTRSFGDRSRRVEVVLLLLTVVVGGLDAMAGWNASNRVVSILIGNDPGGGRS